MMQQGARPVPTQLPQGLTIMQGQGKARVPRYPKHTFNITQRPYEITPFMIAPVLSGETLKNLLLQCRTVSTALENRLIGHHLEHYFFYVKLRHLSDSADIIAMLMDTDLAGVNTAGANNAYHYVQSGAPDYVKMCLDSIVTHYFRDEGDTGSHVGAVTGLPLAQWTNYKSIAESLIDNVVIETDTITNGNPFPDHEKEYQTWMYMRQMQLTEVSFEDYLGTFGVRLPDSEISRPELIRMVRNWTYPTNTLDGDGTINSQVSWSVQERADKDRFFKEPGFLFGVTIAKPKVYLSIQDQSAVSLLGDAFSWLPALMKDNPESSLKKIAGNSAFLPWTAASTPTGGQLDSDNAYWVDVRDLYLYGDQFVNRTLDPNTNNSVAPENFATFHGKKYPSSAALQLIGKSDILTYESDGIVSLNILGTQLDMT